MRMPLQNHGIPNAHRSQEAEHPVESASILCLAPLTLFQFRPTDSEPISNTAEQMPGVDFSTMQTINPALVFPNALTTTQELLNVTADLGAAGEIHSITSCSGISSTWPQDQPQENPQKIHDTTVCIRDPLLPESHIYSKQPGHNPEVGDQELHTHRRKFKCKINGCRMGFKRQDHLERHIRSHSKEKPYVCWVPGCHRAFSRRDNLNVHCMKTHTSRGGRNRYVATLDKTNPDYDPGFRGQLSIDGRPLRIPASCDSLPDTKLQQR
jgi:hypothetical protein